MFSEEKRERGRRKKKILRDILLKRHNHTNCYWIDHRNALGVVVQSDRSFDDWRHFSE